MWLQARSITTPEQVDEKLARIEAGRFDVVFVNVLAGHAYFESALLKKYPAVPPDNDPLAYFVEQAHRRGIAVHAWLVAGPFRYRREPGPTFIEHPDWARNDDRLVRWR